MVLMVSLSSRISPLTCTVIFFERSPVATAFVTSAMLRTCAVRLPAMKFTLSVRSFQVPATPFTSAWPPSFPSEPTSRATRVTSDAKPLSWSTIVLIVSFSTYFTRHARNFRCKRIQLVDHRVDGVFEFENFTLHVDGDFLGEVAVG